MESPAPSVSRMHSSFWTRFRELPPSRPNGHKRPPALPKHPSPGDSEEAEGQTAWYSTAIKGPWEVPVFKGCGYCRHPHRRYKGRSELSPPRVPSAGASKHTLQRRPCPGSGGHITTLQRRTVRAALGGPSDRPSCDRSNECALVTPFDLRVPGLRSELVTPTVVFGI